MLLDGKVALVTGGGSGFGRAASQALAAEGAAVVVADVREEGALETAEGIRQRGGRAIALAGDVSREAEARRLVDATLDEFGRLDILDNNAGVDAGGGITEFTLDELNLRSPFAKGLSLMLTKACQAGCPLTCRRRLLACGR